VKPFPAALLLAPLAIAAACGSGRSSRPPGPNEVVMTDYRFHPAKPTVRRGVELTVRNEGQLAHNLTVERAGSAPEELIGTDTFLTGESRKLRVDLSPGRYAIVCTVPGHEQRGMVGTLTVR
jgi:plastocyanin